MGLFTKLFNQSRSANANVSPPISGGKGTSQEDPVVVNCHSMGMANRLIDNWISERHGVSGVEWRRDIEMFVDGDTKCRMIGVSLSDGTKVQYYFDVSKPMAGSMNVARLVGAIPR